MSTRRFEAASTPAALDAVRAAFGEDAFILSNRRRGNRVEIIASASDEGEPRMATAESELGQGTGAPRTTRISIESLAGMASDRESGKNVSRDPKARTGNGAGTGAGSRGRPRGVSPSERGSGAAAAPATAAVAAVPDPAAIEAAVRAAVNASLGSLFPGLASSTADAGYPHGSADETAFEEAPPPEPVDPETEARQLAVATGAALSKTVDDRLRRIEVALWGFEDPPRSQLLDRLLQLGLGASTAVRLSEQARGSDVDSLMRDALARLRDSLPILRGGSVGTQGVLGVKLLSGPDSDARMALLLQFAHAAIALGGPRSVALVSADTARAGAFSMLEECARTLGCVTVRVRRPEELEATVMSLSDRDCVLVDAGDTWPACASVQQRLLVLPATRQRTVCEKSITKARRGQATGCVLCSLHEAGRPGESLEALIEHWLPIAFWSDSNAIEAVPKRAEAAVLVAAAVGSARRLGSSEHDRLLASLLHPGRGGLGTGFSGTVQIPTTAARPNKPDGDEAMP